MDKHGLLPAPPQQPRPHKSPRKHIWSLLLSAVLVSLLLRAPLLSLSNASNKATTIPINAQQIIQKCQMLDVLPAPPPNFHSRLESDRYSAGTKSVLIKNATIWTGGDDGHEIVHGEVVLDKGIVKYVGSRAPASLLDSLSDLEEFNVQGAWVSPGIVDLHSHLGVYSVPSLSGASDGNSRKGPVLPWLRSLDALNTHDDAYRLSISGGITTAVVLPGSANAIGGQAFAIKLRPTAERSPTSMLLEPPFGINGSEVDPTLPPRWRLLKQACGENPSRVYSGTRMDTIWAFRQGYETARKIKVSQDAYCSSALSGHWEGLGEFPEDLQWEALVDVLRGRVKIQNHCYETVDLDDIVRLSNEFKFPIAAFHHAHETYLVPETLKRAYGHPPAIAMFATNARYKRESYRGSEFAPRILADEGLKVVMKSDHPVLNSRYLLYEAQQAHYYGLPANLAMAAVTTTPAEVMGMGHRVGYLKKGYDADVVVWDSHPLSLGATPKQVYIDGIAQLSHPHTTPKPPSFQHLPKTPNFDKETSDALKYEGLPPLEPREKLELADVAFTRVGSVYVRDPKSRNGIRELYGRDGEEGVVFVRNGTVICADQINGSDNCMDKFMTSFTRVVDLAGGSIAPGLVAYGSPLALHEIQGEASTADGYVFDALEEEVPKIVGGEYSVIRAVDGLQYATRDALIAYRAGVTTGVTPPKSAGFFSGLSTAFSTGSAHKLEKGAVIQEVAAFHVSVGHGGNGAPSVSTQIAVLRRLLVGEVGGEMGEWIGEVKSGKIPLVINVESADVMATLIKLKEEVETEIGETIKVTFTGASEAHLLAKEIGAAGVGVILTPSRPFPQTWEQRRILPGPPLTEHNAVSLLLGHNVTVGIGIPENWAARNIRFDAAWAALEAKGDLSKTDTLALASVNLEKLLGVSVPTYEGDLVATWGGDLLEFESKVVGIVSPSKGIVDLI